MAANPLVKYIERQQDSLNKAAGFYKPRRRTLSGDRPRYPNIYGTARRPNPASAKVAQRRKKNVRFAEESVRRRRQTPPGPLGLALGWAGGVLGAGSKELLEMFTGTARTGWETSKDLFDVATAISPSPLSAALDYKPDGRKAAARSGARNLATIRSIPTELKQPYVGDEASPLDQRGFTPRAAFNRFTNQPFRTGLNFAAGFSLTGGAVRGAVKGGAFATRPIPRISHPLERFASKATEVITPYEGMNFLGQSPNFAAAGKVPRRRRGVEVLRPPESRGMPEGAQPVYRSLRPRSGNIISREIQKNITDPVIGAVKRGLYKTNLPVVGGPSRYKRNVRAQDRREAYSFMADAQQQMGPLLQPFQMAVREVDSAIRKGKLGGGRRRSARTATGRRAHTAAVIRAMGLNNISTAKGSVSRSRTQGRDNLADMYQSQLDKADAEGAAVPDRAAIEQNIETLRSIPDEWLDPATAPQSINRLTDETVAVLRESTNERLASGSITQRTAERSGRRNQYIAFGLWGKVQAADKARQAAAEAGQRAAAARAELAKVKKESAKDSRRSREKRALAEQRKKTQEADRLQREVDSAMEGIEPGEYYPAVRVTKPQRSTANPVLGGTSRMTAIPTQMSEGILMSQGRAGFSPDLTAGALRTAFDIGLRSDAVATILSRHAVKDASGQVIRGAAAKEIADNSNGMYQLVGEKTILDTLNKGRKENVVPRSEFDEAVQAYLESVGEQNVLVPKAAIKGWQDALGPEFKPLGRGIDTLNSYWKAGVLALNPRWYLQNMVGMWGQFALGAGADLQAIRMAAQPKYKKMIPEDLDAFGFSYDVGELARRVGQRPSKNTFNRMVAAGYRFNAAFEAVPRRAMAIHATKKKLREEGVIGGFVKDAELAEAWLAVAKAERRGEPWARSIVDQAILETERFMGQYVRYNPLERTILRRAYPFYGWMRAIHRLAFALPVKYPKRAALLSLASRMAYEMYADDESLNTRPYATLLNEGGTRATGTSILNVPGALEEGTQTSGMVAENLKRGEYTQALGTLGSFASGQLGPVAGVPYSAVSGERLTGVPLFIDTPGGIERDPLTGRTFGPDPSTQGVTDVPVSAGLGYYLSSQFPILNLATAAILDTTKASGQRLNTSGNFLNVAWNSFQGRLRNRDFLESIIVPQKKGRRPTLKQEGWRDRLTTLLGAPQYDYDPKGAYQSQRAIAAALVRARRAEATDRRRARRALR